MASTHPAADYRRATLVTTLSPSDMCREALLLDDAECAALMADFIREQPHVWNEDISV